MNSEVSTYTFQSIVVKENSAIPWFFFSLFNTLVEFMIIIVFFIVPLKSLNFLSILCLYCPSKI